MNLIHFLEPGTEQESTASLANQNQRKQTTVIRRQHCKTGTRRGLLEEVQRHFVHENEHRIQSKRGTLRLEVIDSQRVFEPEQVDKISLQLPLGAIQLLLGELIWHAVSSRHQQAIRSIDWKSSPLRHSSKALVVDAIRVGYLYVLLWSNRRIPVKNGHAEARYIPQVHLSLAARSGYERSVARFRWYWRKSHHTFIPVSYS